MMSREQSAAIASSSKTRKERIWAEQERETVANAALPLGPRIVFALVCLVSAILRPAGNLRVGLLRNRALGRFCGGTEYYLRRRKLFPPIGRELPVLISGPPISRQLLRMIGREVRVIESASLWRSLDRARKARPDHPVWIDLSVTGWLRGAGWSEPGPQLRFTTEEHARGQALLRRLGVSEGVGHVCIFAKDRLYADDPLKPPDPDSYWGSKDFRNCDIRNYLSAAEYLAKRGIHVFRMGLHEPEALLPDGLHPGIIDYTGRIRSTLDDPDFADVYLQATCKFFVGCTSGIYLMSSIFGVPIASANMVPYGECGRTAQDIFIVKKCRDRKSGKFIPFADLIARGLDADWLTEAELKALDQEGIEFVENSGDEILALVREMDMRLDETWRDGPEDDTLQRRYRDISPARNLDGSEFPGRIGAVFLRENQGLMG